MSSLGLDAWHVDLAVPEEDIFERALALAEEADSLRAPILARAQAMQLGLHEYARNLLANSPWRERPEREDVLANDSRYGRGQRTGT
jgi:hypothetical protein